MILKKASGILSLTLLSLFAKSQQEVQNSLYMFNPSIVNPAYAGSRDALSGIVDYRQQWVKWDGAPTTAMLCLHSPLKMDAVALGLNIVNDKIGATNNTAMYGDFAYRIHLNKGKFGTNNKQTLSFGMISIRNNFNGTGRGNCLYQPLELILRFLKASRHFKRYY